MNISKEEIRPLEACISVHIAPEDYQETVNKKLKEYQKKSNVPGFRPGMAPFAMIKKLYGKAVLVDEVEKLLQEALENYLKEEDIKTLGTALASENKEMTGDWDNPDAFEFHFDIGMKPEFDVNLSKDIEVDYYQIIPTEEELEKEIENIKKSFGSFEEVEVSEVDDWLTVTLEELDEEGKILENGITHERRITRKTFDEDITDKLTGLKSGDTLVINPKLLMQDSVDKIAFLLGRKKEEVSGLTHDFRLTVNKIERYVDPELNEELYKKIFPEEEITSFEDFKKALSNSMSLSYSREVNTTFFRAARKKLMETYTFSLPEVFLKRWIRDKEEDHHHHDHEGDHDHDHTEHSEADDEKVLESMKWQLIENNIIEKYNIRVELQEVKDYIKERYRNYFLSQGAFDSQSEEVDKTLDMLVAKYMEKREDVESTYDILFYNRLLNIFKDNLTLVNKEVTHEAFHQIDEEYHEHHHHH